MLRLTFLCLNIVLSGSLFAQEAPLPFNKEPVATFNEPWAMTFLPDGRILITEKRGQLLLVSQSGEKSRPIENVPDVDYRGQGGLGEEIPDHHTRPEFAAPKVAWIPTIAPSGLMFYSGDQFPQLQGSALIPGLAAAAIIRVEFDGDTAREAERFPMGKRIREVEQGPEGSLWVIEDGDGGRLLKLTPLDN